MSTYVCGLATLPRCPPLCGQPAVPQALRAVCGGNRGIEVIPYPARCPMPCPTSVSDEKRWFQRNRFVLQRLAKALGKSADEVANFLYHLTLRKFSEILNPKAAGWNWCRVPLTTGNACDLYSSIFDLEGNLYIKMHRKIIAGLLQMLHHFLNEPNKAFASAPGIYTKRGRKAKDPRGVFVAEEFGYGRGAWMAWWPGPKYEDPCAQVSDDDPCAPKCVSPNADQDRDFPRAGHSGIHDFSNQGFDPFKQAGYDFVTFGYQGTGTGSGRSPGTAAEDIGYLGGYGAAGPGGRAMRGGPHINFGPGVKPSESERFVDLERKARGSSASRGRSKSPGIKPAEVVAGTKIGERAPVSGQGNQGGAGPDTKSVDTASKRHSDGKSSGAQPTNFATGTKPAAVAEVNAPKAQESDGKATVPQPTNVAPGAKPAAIQDVKAPKAQETPATGFKNVEPAPGAQGAAPAAPAAPAGKAGDAATAQGKDAAEAAGKAEAGSIDKGKDAAEAADKAEPSGSGKGKSKGKRKAKRGSDQADGDDSRPAAKSSKRKSKYKGKSYVTQNDESGDQGASKTNDYVGMPTRYLSSPRATIDTVAPMAPGEAGNGPKLLADQKSNASGDQGHTKARKSRKGKHKKGDEVIDTILGTHAEGRPAKDNLKSIDNLYSAVVENKHHRRLLHAAPKAPRSTLDSSILVEKAPKKGKKRKKSHGLEEEHKPKYLSSNRLYYGDQIPVLRHEPFDDIKPWTWLRRDPRQDRVFEDGDIGRSKIHRYRRESIEEEFKRLKQRNSVHSQISVRSTQSMKTAAMFGKEEYTPRSMVQPLDYKNLTTEGTETSKRSSTKSDNIRRKKKKKS